jgi:CheY-like chemotaxis protein
VDHPQSTDECPRRALSLLLVDDEPNVTAGLRRSLRTLAPEWSVRTAESGNQGLELLAVEPVDVVVSDFRMHGMTGADFVREVLARYPWTIRIILTGMLDEQSLLQGTRWSERYLCKPCPPERLRAEILEAVARRERDRALVPRRAEVPRQPVALLIEDSPEDVELLRQALTRIGDPLEVYHVPHAAAALDFIARTGPFAEAPPPDVLLLDLNLPMMTGYEFLSRYRNLAVDLAPVIVVSNSRGSEEREESIRHGAAAFIAKPSTWDLYLDLARTIAAYARKVAASRRPSPPAAREAQ